MLFLELSMYSLSAPLDFVFRIAAAIILTGFFSCLLFSVIMSILLADLMILPAGLIIGSIVTIPSAAFLGIIVETPKARWQQGFNEGGFWSGVPVSIAGASGVILIMFFLLSIRFPN